MTTRTFKQYGIAFGSQTANITAKIDNVVVYQGPVTTLDESVPSLPNLGYQVTNELFSWTTDLTFEGPQLLEITIDQNAALLITTIKANYSPIANPDKPWKPFSTGPDGYEGIPYSQFGNTYINDVLQSVTHGPETEGQWWWSLPPSGVFVENLTINPGVPEA